MCLLLSDILSIRKRWPTGRSGVFISSIKRQKTLTRKMFPRGNFFSRLSFLFIIISIFPSPFFINCRCLISDHILCLPWEIALHFAANLLLLFFTFNLNHTHNMCSCSSDEKKSKIYLGKIGARKQLKSDSLAAI